MNRWDFLFLAGTLSTIFVPIAVAVFAAHLTGPRRNALLTKHIAEYRTSPDSSLLRLNDRRS